MKQDLLQLAKAFEFTTLSKKDAVGKFGTEGQKNNFNKHNKFTGDTAKSFKRTLEEYFEEVDDTVKLGRGKGYKLGKARDEVARRETDNSTNGRYDKSTKHLDALMLAHLEDNLINGHTIQKSHADWLLEFRMINEATYKLYKSKFDRILREDTENLIKKETGSVNTKVLNYSYDFFMVDISSQKSKMLSALGRLEKNGIVETFDRHKAYLNEPLKGKDGKEIYVINVDSDTYQLYKDEKRRLMDKYQISEEDIAGRTYNPTKETLENVKKYKMDIKNFLAEDIEITDTYGKKIKASIKNIWKELAIIVKATKKKTMDYLHKFHSEILAEYQIYKYEKFLSTQAIKYRTHRTKERLTKAEKKRENHIKHVEKDDEYSNRKKFGDYANINVSTAREFKVEFMDAIEKLDKIFGDNFIIDEEKIKETLNKKRRR